MFLFIESLRFFRESYVKSIHAFNGRTLLNRNKTVKEEREFSESAGKTEDLDISLTTGTKIHTAIRPCPKGQPPCRGKGKEPATPFTLPSLQKETEQAAESLYRSCRILP